MLNLNIFKNKMLVYNIKMGKYYCAICNKTSMQKSHHEAHLKSDSHKDKRKWRYFEIKEKVKESGCL